MLFVALLLPAQALAAETFVAGEVGVVLQVYANSLQVPPATPVSLTGATATLVVVSPAGTRSVLSLTVSSDGTYATYTTTGTDFPVAGTYQLQLVASFSGQTLKSAPFGFRVERQL